jgi:hypothetical protein
MAITNKVITGAIAFIKVDGIIVGKMKDVRINESFRRVRVSKGLGSIFADEFAVTEWNGTLSCSFMEIDYKQSGIPFGVLRTFLSANIMSQIGAGVTAANFEDNLVLDYNGVTVEVYKKLQDVIDPVTRLITPSAVPYATVNQCFIDSDNVNISEGQIAGRDQSFQYLLPVVVKP